MKKLEWTYGTSKRRAIFWRLCAAFIIVPFTLTNISYAGPSVVMANSAIEVKLPSFSNQISLPQNLGTIQKRWASSKNQALPFVIHIQDSHASYEAQTNIKCILDYLQKNYGVRTFFLEGAVGQLDRSAIQLFSSKEKNLEAAELLAERGTLSGSELALMESASLKGFGVEDLELYKKNFAEYQSVLQKSEPLIHRLTKIRAQILRQSSRHFSSKLYKLFKALRSSDDLLSHVSILDSYAKEELQLDFTKALSQVEWPQLVRLTQLKHLEKKLDRKKAAEEQIKLTQWLARKNLDAPYQTALRQITTPGQLYRKWAESPRSFLERFYEAAGPKGFDFKNYPNLSHAFAAAVLESEIEPSLLNEEMERLRDQLFEHLAQNPKEKELIRSDQGLELLQKLFKLELTPKEYAKLIADGSWLVDTHELSAMSHEPNFMDVYQCALNFYRDAKKRDAVMFKRLIEQMKSLDLDKVVLVTGGFHSEGLEREFQSRGISYLQILPHLSETISSKAYQDVMLYKNPLAPRTKQAQIPLARLLDPNALKPGYFNPGYADFARNEMGVVRQTLEGSSAAGRSEVRARRDILGGIQALIDQETRNFFEREFSGLENTLRPEYFSSELPLPVSYDRIQATRDIPLKAELILHSILEEMQASDKTLIEKMKVALYQATLRSLDSLSEDELSSAEKARLSGNFQRNFAKFLKEEVSSALRDLFQEAAHAPVMLDEIRKLSVSAEIEKKYTSLPHLLKYYFTLEPKLLQNPEVTTKLQAIRQQMQQRVDLAQELGESLPEILDKIARESKPEPLVLVKKKNSRPQAVKADFEELPQPTDSGIIPDLKIETEIPPADPYETSQEVAALHKTSEEKVLPVFVPNQDQINVDELILSLKEAVKANDQVVIKILREEISTIKQKLRKAGEQRSEMRSDYEQEASSAGLEEGAPRNSEEDFPSLVELRAAELLFRSQQTARGFKTRYGPMERSPERITLVALVGAGVGMIAHIILAGLNISSLSISHFIVAAFLGSPAVISIYLLMSFMRSWENDYAFKTNYEALKKFYETTDPDFPEYALERAMPLISLLSPETFQRLCDQWVIRGQMWKLQRILKGGTHTGVRHQIIASTFGRASLLQVREQYYERFHNEPETLARIEEDFQHWFKISGTSKQQIESEVETLKLLLSKFSRYDEISYWVSAFWASRNFNQPINLEEFNARYAAFKGISQTLTRGDEHFALTPHQVETVMDAASYWVSNLPVWSRDQKFFKAASGLISQIITLSPNAEWYLYGINILFSTPVTSQQLPDTSDYLVHRVENIFVYGLLRSSLLEGMEGEMRNVAEDNFKGLETFFGEPENESSKLFMVVDGLGRLRSLTHEQRAHRLNELTALRSHRFNPETVHQLMRFYLDKEDAKDALIHLSSSPLANLINHVDVLLDKQNVENFRARLGIYHYLIEKLDKKEAEPGDVARILGIFEKAGPWPEVLQACFGSWEALFNFYFERKGRGNFEELPEFLRALYERKLKVTVLFPTVLEVLTDPDMQASERLAKLKALKAEYDLADADYPTSLGAVWDAVSVQSLFETVGKAAIKNRINVPVVRNVLSKVGSNGLQSYWERTKPDYYTQFLGETKGIPESFFSPGEKFRFAYARASAGGKVDDQAITPVTNPVSTMKKLVEDLRWRHKNYYENFITPKRELLQGRNLEEFINEQSVEVVAKQFCAKLQDWEMPEQEKINMALKVLGVLFHSELSPNLRDDPGESKEEQLARYWSDFLNHIKGKGYIRKGSKLQIALQTEVKKRLFALVSDQTESREGVIQVMLTRGSLSDFFRGEVSRDCTAEGQAKYLDTIGLPADPAFLSFKFVENVRWVGNIYSMLFKAVRDTEIVHEGDYVVYVDQVAIDPRAALGFKGKEYATERQLFATRFFEGMSQYLALKGVRFMMLANDPSVLDYMRAALTDEIKNRQWPIATLTVLKPGGMGHMADLGVSNEYIQAIGNIKPQMDVSGFLIELNMEDAKAAEMKRRATEFKKKVTLRRGELDRIVEELIHLEDESAKVSLAVSVYKQRKRTYTVMVLERALERLREERLALQGQADVMNEEIETLEANMNGVSRSESRTNPARSEVRSVESEPPASSAKESLAYSITMRRLKSQAEISRTRLETVREQLTQLERSLAAVEKNKGAAVPAPAMPNPESEMRAREREQAQKQEYSQGWWKDFLAGKVTRLRLRPRAKLEKTKTPEEMRREIELLEHQQRLLQDELAHQEKEMQVVEAWRNAPDPNAPGSPLLEALQVEQRIHRIIAGVPQTLWTELNKRFPNQPSRSFNLQPNDVVKKLMQTWEASDYFGKILEVLDANGSFNRWFSQQAAYQAFKSETQHLGIIPEFDRPGTWVRFEIPSDPAHYSLVLSERNAEYLLRGFVSGDCTNCGPMYNTSSFVRATTTHIADPGMLNFKVMRDGEWIGNVYALVLENEGKPVLVIDAIQIPWQGDSWEEGASPLFLPFDFSETRFPVKKSQQSFRIAAGVMLALARYAQTTHFKELWLSSFVSNFLAIQQYFSSTLKPEIWDRNVVADQKVGGLQVIESLGYQGRPYVESISNPQARLIWPHPDRQDQLARISAVARAELRTLPGIGIRMKPEDQPLLDQAIEAGQKSDPIDLNEYLSENISGFSLDQDIQYPELLKLMTDAKFKIVAVKAAAAEGTKHVSPGLGLDRNGTGNDVYTAVRIEYGAKETEPVVTIYIGYGLYELATDSQRKAMILHGFYLAYRALNEASAEKYPIEIDLERMIDRRIATAATEPAQTGAEAQFPGFQNQGADRRDLLVRARIFSGLVAAQNGQTAEEDLSSILGKAIGLEKQFSGKKGMFEYVESNIAELDGDKMERVLAVAEYVKEHWREDFGEYLDEKIQEGTGKDVIVLDTGAPTPLILGDVRKITEHLAQGNRLRNLYLDLPPALQGSLDQFLLNGRMTPDFLKKIEARFPPFLPKEFARPDLYEAILRAVYVHNQDTPADQRIRVHASYQPPVFPNMPFNLEGGELPEIPGMGGMPGMPNRPDLGNPGAFDPHQPWMPPAEVDGGDDKMAALGNLLMPQMPEQSSSVLKELLQREAVSGTVTLMINPMEELLSEELSQNPRVVSILHIDRYTGFGPQKEVNQLALFMSEAGGPKKTFALPIHFNAPFHNEPIHAGVPEGLPFNLFRSYKELIMSTADEGGDKEVPEPLPITPETVPRAPDLVPVGGRSELRQPPELLMSLETASPDLMNPKEVMRTLIKNPGGVRISLADGFSWEKFKVVAEAKLAYDLAVYSPERLKPLSNRMTEAYRDLERTSREMKEFLNRKTDPWSLDAEELVKEISRIELWKDMLQSRWYVYNRIYASLLSPSSLLPQKLMEEISLSYLRWSKSSILHAVQTYPEVQKIWEMSGADRFNELMTAEAKVKGALRKKLKQRPDLYKELMVGMHERSDKPLDDPLIKWLFGIHYKVENRDADQTILKGDQLHLVDGFGPTPYSAIQWALKQFDVSPRDVFYDLGSGFGEIVLYAALATSVGKAVGVELSKSRTDDALKAKKRMGIDRAEFIQGDVRAVDLSNGTIFYLFNPFGDDRQVEETVIEKLKTVARQNAAKGKVTRILASLGMLDLLSRQPWLKITESKNFLVIFTSKLDPAVYSRSELRKKEQEKSGVSSSAVTVARDAAEKTVRPGLSNSETRLFVEKVAPEEFERLSLRSTSDPSRVQTERLFLKTFFSNRAKLITDDLQGQGRVILSGDTFKNQAEIFKTLLNFLTLEQSSDENDRPASYIFAGKTAGILKEQLESKQSELNGLDKRLLQQVIGFKSGEFSKVVAEESSKQEKTGLILSAQANEAASFVHKILSAIEPQEGFFDPNLTIEQNASAYYVRARLLKQLASELEAYQRKAVQLKRAFSGDEVKTFISDFFRENLGIAMQPDKNGSLNLSLSTVHAQLEIFRQSYAQIQQSA